MEQEKSGFASNGKVSIRQMSRMMFLELFGFGTLVLPGPLSRICQTDGVFSILAAGGIWSLMLFYACRFQARKIRKHPPEEQQTGFGKKSKAILQSVIFAIGAGFLLYLIASIVERQLLDTSYLWIIVVTILLGGGYGIVKGLECRARIYEILFWILLVPLILILFIALWNVTPDYWLPVFASGFVPFLAGVGICLIGFLPALLCVLLVPACIEPQEVSRMAVRIMLLAAASCGGVYLLLIGVFQSGLLSVLKYPIISLMSVVQIPGNLLERLDAPMVTIWFFCLFALFHSLCYYCVDGVKKLLPRNKHTTRKVLIGMILILITSLMMLLHGCGKKGPEENRYPLAIGIQEDKDTGQMKVSYAMPKLDASGGGQGASNSDGGQDTEFADEVATISVDSLFQAQEQLSMESDKTIDLNHMKVFLISRQILQDEEGQEQLFLYFLENESMAWNTYLLFVDEDMEDLFAKDTTGGKSMGTYLEDLLHSRQNMDTKTLFTVQDYISLYQNKTETMLAPMISLKDGKLFIDKYCIVSRGYDRGILSLTDSSYAQILLGKQEKLSMLLERDQYVTLQNIRMEKKLTVDSDGTPQQRILIKANLKLSADWVFTREEKNELLEEARQTLEIRLNEVLTLAKEEHHADITNSYLAMSGYHRNLWLLYRDNPDAYEKKLNTVVEVKLKLLET